MAITTKHLEEMMEESGKPGQAHGFRDQRPRRSSGTISCTERMAGLRPTQFIQG